MITVDITTKNTVFNPLSAQGSWIQHRFGQRKYPAYDLDKDTITNIFSRYKQVFVRCVYGDALCHPNIYEIIDLAIELNVNLILFSYLNTDDNKLINFIKNSPVCVFTPVDGFYTYGKTILESNQKLVYNNLQILGSKATVEYHLYNYNIHEIEVVKEFCKNNDCGVQFQPGKNFGLPVTSIINKNGEWMYDVVPMHNIFDSPGNRILEQTLEGHRSLLDYIKPIKGISILDNPAISKRLQTTKRFVNDMPAVSVTGHLFESTEEMFAFSNALCTDWRIDYELINKTGNEILLDEYSMLIGITLNNILDRGLKRFCDSDV